MFKRSFIAGWADMDSNSHMRNTAFLDRSADVRMMYFADNGFSAEAFRRRAIGPVVMSDEVRYYREIGLLEAFDVTLQLAGLAEDGSRFKLRNQIFRADGELAARVTSHGGWLDLVERRLLEPPPDLLAPMQQLDRIEEFEVLPSSLR